jgi:Flp pilus assembly protein TadG
MHWFKKRRSSFGGASTVLGLGAAVIGVSASVFAIDVPYYFNAQNQLQTSLDAAALAGAAQLPNGTTQAQQAALSLAQKNIVAGKALKSGDLTFKSTKTKFTVTGKTEVPTLIGKFLCAFGRKASRDPNQTTTSGAPTGETVNCDSMSVSASSSAAPAARDTVLVIDASSSMYSLGNGRPLSDVQKAAINYIKTIAALQNDSVDRIGLVKFHLTGTLLNPLTSQQESAQYSSVQSKVSAITLYNGSSWNTNYEAGLKVALDELASRGRPNAEQRVIFMTDGMPNQPAPSSYNQYSSAYPYNKCIDIVNNSSAVKALCTRNRNGQLVCPVLPNPAIKPNMIPSSATSCTKTYVDHVESITNAQTDRAKNMGVTIDTIVISDPDSGDNASAVLRIMLKDPNWDPTEVAHYMNITTGGQAYTALAYDATAINSIYAKIAQDIRIRLTNN